MRKIPIDEEQYRIDFTTLSREDVCNKWGIAVNTFYCINAKLGLKKSRPVFVCKPPKADNNRGKCSPEGTITEVFVARTGKKILRRKTGEVWQDLHIFNWLAAGNTIPEGKVLTFKVKDHLRCEPENMELIGWSELTIRARQEKGLIATGINLHPSRKQYYDERRVLREKKKKEKEEAKQRRREEWKKFLLKQSASKKERLRLLEEIRLKKKEDREAKKEARRQEKLAKKAKRGRKPLSVEEKTKRKLAKQRDEINKADAAKKELSVDRQWRRQKKQNEEKRSRKIPTLHIDHSQQRLIKIDARTSISIKRGEDEQAAIEKFYKMHPNYLKKTA